MAIEFTKAYETSRFHSPLEQMELVEHRIERRRDPLTGRWAIGSSGLEGKGQFFFAPPDYALIENVAAATRENCFFCPEHVETATPRYPEAWLEGGMLRAGECRLFPNLFPLSAVHAVVALGEKHVRRLSDFPAALLDDGLAISVRFCESVHRAEPDHVAFTINANYLFPAGASIVHPHLQVFGGKIPATHVTEILQACARHQQEHGRAYFDELIEEEQRRGERYVAADGPVHWITPFAPVGTNEVLGIVPGCAHLLHVDDDVRAALARGLSRVLAFYDHIGFSTFNFSVYTPPVDGAGSGFPVLVRVVCRQNVRENYRTDDYFIQKMLGEELMLTTPETLARQLRDFWEEAEG